MKILKIPSPNFNERLFAIDSIIIHYTDMVSTEEALLWLSMPESQVSSHYLIDETGQVYQFVNEEHRAWHAGESYWQECKDLNSCSIGIELANPGHSNGYQPFPKPQIDSLIKLCQDIKKQWNIPPSRILGHSDIAPRRKQDPGHLFPWKQLAQEGLGLWPEAIKEKGKISLETQDTSFSGLLHPARNDKNDSHCEAPEEPRQSIAFTSPKHTFDILEAFKRIGYEIISPSHTLLAFQRHFQPHKVDGIADEETLSLIKSLL